MNIVELKPISADLINQIPIWYNKKELGEYFRSWPALQDINRPDLLTQRLDWAYEIREDGKLVGMVQLYYPNQIAKTVEVGMVIDNELSSNRYETSYNAHIQIIDYIFNKLEYQKIYMRILSHRDKLRKRLLDFGYHIEGLLKRSAKFNHELHDEYLLAYYKE